MYKVDKFFYLFFIHVFLIVNLPHAHAMESSVRSSAESLQVDPHSGSGSVSFPILVPQGRGGIQPNLALSYNSNAKEGLSGYGWNMELGSVHRSTKNGLLSFSGADTFLLLQNGSTQEFQYSSPPPKFQLIHEGSFMKIWQDNAAFHMKDRNGIHYIFGEDNLSREFDPNEENHILRWGLNHVEDVHGNYMDITYDSDGNKIYPLKIEYTGNSQAPSSPFATIDFVYDNNRPDPQYSFVSGIKLTTSKLLTEIIIKVNGILQRKYVLTYQISPVTNRSLLTSIKQIGSDGVKEFPETTFTYETNGDVIQKFSDVISIEGNISSGDNLWNHRRDSSFDHGHETFGSCPPINMCGRSVEWGAASTLSFPNGRLTYSENQDIALWYWTYLYVDTAQQPLFVDYQVNENSIGVWINGNYSTNYGKNWYLNQGWNLVEITDYHQHQGISFNLGTDLSNRVQIMNSKRISSP
ncbi:MAG: hypothetical protein KC733_06190, partial [Candidatus Omnitrophica bacterium]|nr:hypothetical protein [Candidatus Omnitrophota bacterium]